MIKIDFNVAIAAYLFLTIIVVMARWIFYNWYRDSNKGADTQYMEQCPYCTYVFFDFQRAELKICPRCKSLITKTGKG